MTIVESVHMTAVQEACAVFYQTTDRETLAAEITALFEAIGVPTLRLPDDELIQTQHVHQRALPLAGQVQIIAAGHLACNQVTVESICQSLGRTRREIPDGEPFDRARLESWLRLSWTFDGEAGIFGNRVRTVEEGFLLLSFTSSEAGWVDNESVVDRYRTRGR